MYFVAYFFPTSYQTCQPRNLDKCKKMCACLKNSLDILRNELLCYRELDKKTATAYANVTVQLANINYQWLEIPWLCPKVYHVFLKMYNK